MSKPLPGPMPPPEPGVPHATGEATCPCCGALLDFRIEIARLRLQGDRLDLAQTIPQSLSTQELRGLLNKLRQLQSSPPAPGATRPRRKRARKTR